MHLFYQEFLKDSKFYLENEEHLHCVKVLRHVKGDIIHITNGKGLIVSAELTEITRKRSDFEVKERKTTPPKTFSNHIAICPTKQMDRIEWFVEKACELGVDEVTFVQSNNSERTSLKLERLEKKAISALKQSKGGYKTKLKGCIQFDKWIENAKADQKLIAVVNPDNKYIGILLKPKCDNLILIGPEGDFTPEEVELAISHGFEGISLGEKVLRTETAGVVACHAINMTNRY
jgi:16S rRNA (uracil1498-N3)-methyltransferase